MSSEEYDEMEETITTQDTTSGGRGKKKKNKKMKLMSESDQTEEERRALRKDYRKLNRKIVDNTEEMEDPESDKLVTIRDENNTLYKKVAFTREAVLDCDNLHLISSRATKQVDKLVQVPRYDPMRLINKLQKKLTVSKGNGEYSNSYFDWYTLGKEAGACFNALPANVSFLSGPLGADHVPKERKKREKRQQEEESDVEEEEPEDITTQKKDGNQLSAVEQNLKVLHKSLQKRSLQATEDNTEKFNSTTFTNDEERKRAKKRLKKYGSDINGIQYLFNPKSFTQTVENIFHFSFLVKQGKARIMVKTEDENNDEVDSNSNNNGEKVGSSSGNGLVVRTIPNQHGEPQPPKQAVVAFTMKDWKELCKAYNVTKGDLPHRTVGGKKKKSKKNKKNKKKQDEQEDDGGHEEENDVPVPAASMNEAIAMEG